MLYRNRNQALSLDSVLALTHGEKLGPAAFFSQLSPTNAIYTGVCRPTDGNSAFLGQIQYPLGSRSAHLSYLMPASAQESPDLPDLLDHLTCQAGEWGAFHLRAEVDEHSPMFEALRQVSFSLYAWQRIWQYTQDSDRGRPEYSWQPPRSIDGIAVQSLYQSVVPALIQSVESLTSSHLHGLVYRREGELLAYADLVYGPRGIWVQPFIHPEIEDALELLVDLLRSLPHRRKRPIYLCVRSYQAWLESALEDLSIEASHRQAVMVKHLAITRKATQTLRVPILENGHAEPSAPLVHVKSANKSDGAA